MPEATTQTSGIPRFLIKNDKKPEKVKLTMAFNIKVVSRHMDWRSSNREDQKARLGISPGTVPFADT